MRRSGLYVSMGFLSGTAVGKSFHLGAVYTVIAFLIAVLPIALVIAEGEGERWHGPLSGAAGNIFHRKTGRSTGRNTGRNTGRIFRPSSGNILNVAVLITFALLGMQRYSLYDPARTSALSETVSKKSDNVRKRLEERIGNILRDDEAKAIAIAFTLGDKTLIDKNLKSSYKDAGVMHTLTLSGFHVGVIWSMVGLMLSAFRITRRTRYLHFSLSTAIIAAYAVVTGLNPPVVRAGIMLTVWNLMKLIGRRNDRISSLSMAAFVMTLFDPSVLFSAGFQLSFTATAGISVLHPVIKGCAERLLEADGTPSGTVARLLNRIISIAVIDVASISVSCTLATLPLTLCYFGGIPSYFLIANMAVIPCVTLSLYSVAAAVITAPLPDVGNIMAAVTGYIIHALDCVVRYFGS